jgi:hypothetical protein
MRHREAWAEEQRSPTREEWGAHAAAPSARPASAPKNTGAPSDTDPAPDDEDDVSDHPAGGDLSLAADVAREILIVASKLKKYIRARSGMNTSDSVMDVLSARVRSLCDDAIVRAHEDGRKTVMDRDF